MNIPKFKNEHLIFKYEYEIKSLRYRIKNQNLKENELIELRAEYKTLCEVIKDLKETLNGTN